MKKLLCLMLVILLLLPANFSILINRAYADYDYYSFQDILNGPVTIDDLREMRSAIDKAITEKNVDAKGEPIVVFFPLFRNHVPVETLPAKNRNCYYIKDYIGMNLAAIGTVENGVRYDQYGDGKLRIDYITSSGKYILSNYAANYVVIGQGIAPNSALQYQRNEKTDEVRSQSYESIPLYVQLISETPTEVVIDSGINPSDEYRQMVDHWAQALKEAYDAKIAMSKDPTNTKLIQVYMDSVSAYNKASEIIANVEESQLSKGDRNYYNKIYKQNMKMIKSFEQ